ncbi:MAG: hypothetical protein PHU63_04630 [Candidatus ainarchaeum sp.]|nr:hypothetical protein [Candidatus ainarchaeum sp.]
MSELNTDDLKFLSEFQKITGIYPSDCLYTGFAFAFLVDNRGELYKCIGKNKIILNKLIQAFRKPVFLFLKGSDLETQIRNFFHNLSDMRIKFNEKDGGKQVVLIVLEPERGYAVGKDGNKIKVIREFLNKRFGIKDFQLRTTKQFSDNESPLI